MSVPLSWSSTTDRISVLPKPARLGGSTGGAPNSLHSIASAVPLCAEKLHVTSSLPEASRNAPCLAALVASSWNATASGCAAFAFTDTAGPLYSLGPPAAIPGAAQVFDSVAGRFTSHGSPAPYDTWVRRMSGH